MAEIRINEHLKGKNHIVADEKTFPHLFAKYEGYYGENASKYYLQTDFWWCWDENHNLIIESILDSEKLQAKIKELLSTQKAYCENAIEKLQLKLNAINQLKGG